MPRQGSDVVNQTAPTTPEIEDRIRVRGDALHDLYPHELSAVAAVAVQKRLSWSAIFAGFFTALSTMVVLSVLGIAIGLSASDGGGAAWANLGVGAGIWGGISALIAFFAGGWMAGWARPGAAEGNGALQGAMVWMVGLVLIGLGVASGTGAALGAQSGQTGFEAGAAAGSAWWTLVVLVLTLGCAIGGGWLGAKPQTSEATDRTGRRGSLLGRRSHERPEHH